MKDIVSSVPSICCTRCNGTGRRSIPRHLAVTLAVISFEWQGTPEVLRLLGGLRSLERTALCNRLARLFSAGLVERQENGRELEWRLPPKKRSAR